MLKISATLQKKTKEKQTKSLEEVASNTKDTKRSIGQQEKQYIHTINVSLHTLMKLLLNSER